MLSSHTLPDKFTHFCESLRNREFQRIVVLLGAGASTSAGIFSIKSPELKEEISKLDIPFPDVLFDLNYFKFDPYPFYSIFHKLISPAAIPTSAHFLVKCLEENSMLLMAFTKNFDNLERKAGVSENKLILAHGSADKFYCALCGKIHATNKCMEFVKNQKPPFCECGGPVKPDVLFIGEKMSNRFYHGSEMLAYADLMVVIGCSLSVYPFSSLPVMVRAT